MGITLRFEGQGIHKVAMVEKVTGGQVLVLKPGQTVVRIDPRYFGPTEVDTLLGNPGKAHQKLGLVREITAHQICQEMVAADLQRVKRYALLKTAGYRVPVTAERVWSELFAAVAFSENWFGVKRAVLR